MYHTLCGMMHIKDPLLLTERVVHEVVAAGSVSRSECFSATFPVTVKLVLSFLVLNIILTFFREENVEDSKKLKDQKE